MKTVDLTGESTELLQVLNNLETLVKAGKTEKPKGKGKGKETPTTLLKYLAFLGSKYPDPVKFEEVEDILGLHKSQVSRITRGLHKMTYTGEPGLDLVDIYFDIHEPRVKLVVLTKTGAEKLGKAIAA